VGYCALQLYPKPQLHSYRRYSLHPLEPATGSPQVTLPALGGERVLGPAYRI
jgi:hypothetical protein